MREDKAALGVREEVGAVEGLVPPGHFARATRVLRLDQDGRLETATCSRVLARSDARLKVAAAVEGRLRHKLALRRRGRRRVSPGRELRPSQAGESELHAHLGLQRRRARARRTLSAQHPRTHTVLFRADSRHDDAVRRHLCQEAVLPSDCKEQVLRVLKVNASGAVGSKVERRVRLLLPPRAPQAQRVDVALPREKRLSRAHHRLQHEHVCRGELAVAAHIAPDLPAAID
mmetsp:Transcript_29974/g.65590  ORF Transcript_29974/g.65590 Transcript_29974/m.65590 type:complete len:231 (-) Transcript_29974:827-1519(-)